MNEKIKNYIIIGLIIISVVSTSFCIYFGTNNASRTGEQLSSVELEQQYTIEQQRKDIEQLQTDLSGARTATESAQQRSGDLERELGSVRDIIERSIRGANSASNTTEGLIERQRAINNLYYELSKYYSSTKE